MSVFNHLKHFAKKHQVGTYYLLTFIISWGSLLVILGDPQRISSHVTDIPFLPLYFATIAGPSIAGVLLTGFFDGSKGYRQFLSRLFKWRVRLKWYAVAILIAPLTVFASLFALSLYSPVFLPGIFSAGDNTISSMFGLSGNKKITLVAFVLVLGIFNGFVEELGWTGFATPKTSLNNNLFTAGLKIGFMWGLWHLFSNYLGSALGAGSLPLLPYMLVLLFSFLPPFRILMTWVYGQTGSLFIAILMHASLDFFWILSMPNKLTGQQRVGWYILWSVVLWAIVAALGLFRKKEIVPFSNYPTS